jgi:hypothetical protein
MLPPGAFAGQTNAMLAALFRIGSHRGPVQENSEVR